MFYFRIFSNRIAVITEDDRQLTYAQLQDSVDEFYAHVPQKGFVFCLCENSLASLIGYAACMDKGLPLLLLDSTKESGLMQELIEIYQPEYIWLPTKRIEDFAGDVIYQIDDYTLLSMSYAQPLSEKRLNDDLRLCLTTSGSTGSPKLVRVSLNNIKRNTESIADYLHIDENEKPITSLPMHYSYGMSVINSHLIKGATILLTEKGILQPEFWAFAKKYQATSIAGVPYTYEMLRRLRFFQMDLPYMKTMIQAGGKLNEKLVDEFVQKSAECGKEFIVMYGQTEASPRMSYLPWESAAKKPGSIGIAIPGGKFGLIDADGKEITEPDIDGELVFWGENVCLGYAECRADLQKGDENHGVLYTGDVARRDAEEFYYITGRMKRFVKLFGNRVNLDATEQLLKSVTIDVACVGVDDKMSVFITDSAKVDAVKTTLIEKTGINIRGFAIKVIDEIPTNANGKTDYPRLKELL